MPFNLEKYKQGPKKLIDFGEILMNAIQAECYSAEFDNQLEKSELS